MKRAQTGSMKPMWRCRTDTGETVNVFQHTDPAKNSFRHFLNAGYAPELSAMVIDDVLEWTQHPIVCKLTKPDGSQWWDIGMVLDRPLEAMPDRKYVPDLAYWKKYAVETCTQIADYRTDEGDSLLCLFDTETTGLDRFAEIISIALYDADRLAHSTFVRPTDMNRVANTTKVTGITAETLATAPTFKEVYPTLRLLMHTYLWAGWNVNFDRGMVLAECERHGLEPIIALGVHDIMLLFAQYAGDWNAEKHDWRYTSLEDACKRLGIELTDAHDAKADALATLEVLHAIVDNNDVLRLEDVTNVP
jgi:DNA polymerase III epsilon subunit-like protein